MNHDKPITGITSLELDSAMIELEKRFPGYGIFLSVSKDGLGTGTSNLTEAETIRLVEGILRRRINITDSFTPH